MNKLGDGSSPLKWLSTDIERYGKLPEDITLLVLGTVSKETKLVLI